MLYLWIKQSATMGNVKKELELATVVKANALKKIQLFKLIEENNLKKSDINQKAVARELGVSKVTMCKWINGYFNERD